MVRYDHDDQENNRPAVSTLLNTIARLQKRVNELESCNGSIGSNPQSSTAGENSSCSSEAIEIHQLRKELSKVENEKANMELDLMNQLSTLASINQDKMDVLEKKLTSVENENQVLKGIKSSKDNNINCNDVELLKETCQQLNKQLVGFRDVHLSEMKKVKDKYEEKIQSIRGDNELIQNQNELLSNEKESLLSEVTDLRITLENELSTNKKILSEKTNESSRYETQITKLKGEIKSKNEQIHKQHLEMGELNDSIIEIEEQKSTLIDELTSSRQQCERQSQQIESLLLQQQQDQQQDATNVDEDNSNEKELLEQRAMNAEQSIQELQSELQSISSTHRREVEPLKTNIIQLENKLHEEQQNSNTAQQQIQDSHIKVETLTNEIKRIQDIVDEKSKQLTQYEIDLLNLEKQRESYEKRSTHNLQEQITQVDNLQSINTKLMNDNTKLKEDLTLEQSNTKQLHLEIAKMKKNTKRIQQQQQQQPQINNSSNNSSSNNNRQQQTQPQTTTSPNQGERNSVKGLAARFEQNCNVQQQQQQQPETLVDALFTCTTTDSSYTTEEEMQQLKDDIEEKKRQIQILQDKLDSESNLVSNLESEIAVLKAEDTIQKYNTSNEQEQIHILTNQLDVTQRELDEESKLVEQLSNQLEQMKKNKNNTVNNNNMPPFEQRVAENKIKSLQKEITKSNMAMSDLDTLYKQKIHSLEQSIDIMQNDMNNELIIKERDMGALQVQLLEKQDLISKLTKECEMLRNDINNHNDNRDTDTVVNDDAMNALHEELESKTFAIDALHEELQDKTQSLLDMESQIQSLQEQQDDMVHSIRCEIEEETSTTILMMEREIESLQKQMEDKHTNRIQDVEYWKQKVTELEEREKYRTSRDVASQRNLNVVKAENNRLRKSITSLTNEQAQQKSPGNNNNNETSLIVVNSLKEKNKVLKKEVQRLRKRMSNASVMAAAAASSSSDGYGGITMTDTRVEI